MWASAQIKIEDSAIVVEYRQAHALQLSTALNCLDHALDCLRCWYRCWHQSQLADAYEYILSGKRRSNVALTTIRAACVQAVDEELAIRADLLDATIQAEEPDHLLASTHIKLSLP